jgi:hypothetical protein
MVKKNELIVRLTQLATKHEARIVALGDTPHSIEKSTVSAAAVVVAAEATRVTAEEAARKKR